MHRPMGTALPVPPNAPDRQRVQFLAVLSQALLHKNIILPPFVTGQPNSAWNPDAGLFKRVQPATDNRLGALRLPGAAPGRAGDVDLFKLWSTVIGAGGAQKISSAGQWDNVATYIGLELPAPLPGSSHPPATQLAQLYFMLLFPLEEHMKKAQLQALAAQQQQPQNPGQAHQQPLFTPAQMHRQQNPAPGMQNSLGGMQHVVGRMRNTAMGGMQSPTLGGVQNILGMNPKNAINPVATGHMQKTSEPVINAMEGIEPIPSLTSYGRRTIQSSSGIVAISSRMLASDIAIHLGEHGCKNITDRLDMSSCSIYPISSGGFGDVYHAKLYDGTPVAIKTMRLLMDSENSQKPLKDAARELHTWSKCRHRNIVKLLGLVEFQGQIGMVSQWIANGSLPSYLVKHDEADRCQMSLQISEGLRYLHHSNIIHGDLKGANVLISNEGIPLLADFGNAILQERTLQFTHTTVKTSHSPRWAAPEIIEESGTYSFAADVYALGMTILETITGQVPYYEKKKDLAVYYAVAVKREHPNRPEDRIPPRSQHGNTLWSMLTRCWAYEAGARLHVDNVVNMMKTITREGLMPSPPQTVTVTLPATLNPTEQPYTFNLDFDMPMSAYAGDSSARVARSPFDVSPQSNQGLPAVSGLNDLLEAPLPDIATSFKEGKEGGFDMLSGSNEEWWAALVGAAFVGEEQRYEAGPSQTGPSQAGPPHAGPSHPGSSNHASNYAASQEQVVSQLGPDSSVPTSRPPHLAPAHAQPLLTFSHDLPRPGEASHSRSIPDRYPVEDSYSSNSNSYNQTPYSNSTSYFTSNSGSNAPYPSGVYQQQQPSEQPYVNPSPFAQIAHRRSAGLRGPLPTPLFDVLKGTKAKTEKKDPEAFDFSGWGSQYAARPP